MSRPASTLPLTASRTALALSVSICAMRSRSRSTIHSDAFGFTRPFALTAIGNRLAFWNHEQLGMELAPGVDEVSLALVADAWSRTYRSRALTFARTAGAQRTRNGIDIYPDQVATSWRAEQLIPAIARWASTSRPGTEPSEAKGA